MWGLMPVWCGNRDLLAEEAPKSCLAGMPPHTHPFLLRRKAGLNDLILTYAAFLPPDTQHHIFIANACIIAGQDDTQGVAWPASSSGSA